MDKLILGIILIIIGFGLMSTGTFIGAMLGFAAFAGGAFFIENNDEDDTPKGSQDINLFK